MSPVTLEDRSVLTRASAGTMQANVYRAPGRFGLESRPVPRAGPGDAVIRVRLTSICGTDVHIVRGEHPVKPGLVVGHEAVGVVHELGEGVSGFRTGQRVVAGANTFCGQCGPCLGVNEGPCDSGLGGWKLGNTIDGTQAEYALVPQALTNLAPVPASLSDEDVILLTDIATTGFGAAESGDVRIGDSVAVFGQGPIGLCATQGAKLLGAARLIVVEPDESRREVAKRFGATHAIPPGGDLVGRIWELTGGRGVDVAIEAIGLQETFESALRVTRRGGTVSSVGVSYGHVRLPENASVQGFPEVNIARVRAPSGRDRMTRLMRMVEAQRIDLTPLITHRFPFERIQEAYELFGNRQDGVLKVAIRVG